MVLIKSNENPVLGREMRPDRDGAIRKFCLEVQSGGEVSVETALDFDRAVRQIAKRKAWRLGVQERGDMEDVASATMVGIWGSVLTGRLKPTEAPIAAYVAKRAGWEAINLGKRQGVRKRRGEIGPEPEKAVLMEGRGMTIGRPTEEAVFRRLDLTRVVRGLPKLSQPQLKAVTNEINGNQVKGRIHDRRLWRARQSLKQNLDGGD